MHSAKDERPLWLCGESMGALILAWMLAGKRFAAADSRRDFLGARCGFGEADSLDRSSDCSNDRERCARSPLLPFLVHIRKAGTLEGDAG